MTAVDPNFATDAAREARRAVWFTRINKADKWFTVLGLSWLTPMLKAAAGDNPKAQMGEIWRLLGVPLLVPVRHPLGVLVHVVGAGLEIAGVGGVPVGDTGVAGHGHRTAVLAGHTEILALAAGGDHQGVAEGGGENAPG